MIRMPAHKQLSFNEDESGVEVTVMTPAEHDRSAKTAYTGMNVDQRDINKIHYFHMRNWEMDYATLLEHPSGHGGTTVAAQILPAGVIKFAVAVCSKNDNFCRKVGRGIAEQRLRNSKAKHHYYVWRKKNANLLSEFAEWVHWEYAGETIDD